MIKLVVATHGNFASGIMSSLKLIAGDVENVEAIDFVEGMSAGEFKEKLTTAVVGQGQVIVLTDLLGGTPFKTGVELVAELPEQQVAVLSGLNLAMLLDASFSRLTDDFETLVSKLVSVAKEGVVDSISLFSASSNDDDAFEDGI
ncbi:PTS sugar transporter subunit IIA [Streptococcus suis]|nr:PTS sugar transporter subunit IIA [Streptococcus suis]